MSFALAAGKDSLAGCTCLRRLGVMNGVYARHFVSLDNETFY